MGSFIDGVAVRKIGSQTVVRGVPVLTTDALLAKAAGRVFVYTAVAGMAVDLVGYTVIDYFKTDYRLSVRQRAHQIRLQGNREGNVVSAWGSDVPYWDRFLHTRDYIGSNVVWNNLSSWASEESLGSSGQPRDYAKEVITEDTIAMEKGIRETLADIYAQVILSNPTVGITMDDDDVLRYLLNNSEEGKEFRETLKYWVELNNEVDRSVPILYTGGITEEGELGDMDYVTKWIRPLVEKKLQEEMEDNSDTISYLTDCVIPTEKTRSESGLLLLANYRVKSWLDENKSEV